MFICFRDLIIRRKFDENPVLWEMMDLLSEGKIYGTGSGNLNKFR